MGGKQIVNRTKELEIMDSIFSSYKSSSCVFLHGKSGIGKSSISEKFIDKNKNITSFRVLPKRSQQDYNYGYYISQLSHEINRTSDNNSDFNSIADFIKGQHLKKTKQFLVGALDSLIETTALGKIINDGIKNRKVYKKEIEEYFKSFQDDQRYLVIEEYVIQELKGKEFLLNIENIQNIDELSLNTLLKIIRHAKRVFLILEFTDEANNINYTITNLVEKIKTQLESVRIIKTSPLNKDELISIFNKAPDSIADLISKNIIEWNGNVRSIEDLVTEFMYSENEMSLKQINDGTSKLIDRLNQNEQIVLSIISAHNDRCKVSYIKRFNFIKQSIFLDSDQIIKSLLSKGLISQNSEEEVIIEHDSINTSILNSSLYIKHLAFAYKEWLSIYRNFDEVGDFFLSKSQILTKMLLFTSMLNDSIKFLTLLSRVKKEAFDSRDPKKYNDLITSFYTRQKNTANVKILDQIRFWLIEMHLFTETPEEAYVLLNEIEQESSKKDILKAIILPRIGMHMEAIEWTSSLLLKETSSINQELALRLIRMVTYYSIGDTSSCTAEFDSMYNNPKYVNCFEYGFLLRNAELVKISSGYGESIPYYEKSISHFVKHNGNRQALSSQITLGVHLSLVGKYHEAFSVFKDAQINYKGNLSSMHIILNNQAVVLLYLKKYSGIEDLLTTALQFVNEDFNKLVIYSNLFVCLDKTNKNPKELIPIIEEVILNRSFACKDIIRYAYFDIYKYYKDRDQNKEANIYLNKINSLSLPLTPHWKHWLFGNPIERSDPHYYRSQLDRACSFISNWDLEFDSDLMTY